MTQASLIITSLPQYVTFGEIWGRVASTALKAECPTWWAAWEKTQEGGNDEGLADQHLPGGSASGFALELGRMYLDLGDTLWKLTKCSELIGKLGQSDQEQRDLLYTSFVVLLHAMFEKAEALTKKLARSQRNLSRVIAGYSVNESHVQRATKIVKKSKKPDKMRQYFVHSMPDSPWSAIEEDSTLWTAAPVGFPAAPAIDRAVSVTVNRDVEFGAISDRALERVEQIFELLNKAVSLGTT